MTLPYDKIAKTIPMLGTENDAERLAAVHALDRILRASGNNFCDLGNAIGELQPPRTMPGMRPPSSSTAHWRSSTPGAQPMTDWRSVVRFCQLYGVGSLSEKDIDFIDNLARLRPQHLSPRQQDWLGGIASRLGMRRSA